MEKVQSWKVGKVRATELLLEAPCDYLLRSEHYNPPSI
jgi:hypothetical protein